MAPSLTRGRNWSKSYYRKLQHHWRPNPPSEGRCWCPEREKKTKERKGQKESHMRGIKKDAEEVKLQILHEGLNTTMAACSSTPYNSSVRAVLRKHSSASLCFSPLRTHTSVTYNTRKQLHNEAVVFLWRLDVMNCLTVTCAVDADPPL